MNHLHPLSAANFAINRGVIGGSIPFFLVAMGSSLEGVDVGWGFVLAPIGFLVGVGYGVAYYYRFEYGLTDDTFDIESGVVSRRTREIPFRRVQNVDVRQGIFARLLGLAIVTIETAGGGETEATLAFVSREEAERLRREIRSRTAAAKGRGRTARDEAESAASDSAAPGTTGSVPIEEDGDRPVDAGADGIDAESDAVEEGEDVERAPVAGESFEEAWPDERPTRLFRLEARELLLYAFASFRPAAAIGAIVFAFLVIDPLVDVVVGLAQPFGGPADLETASPGEYLVLGTVSAVYGAIATYLIGAVYTIVTYYDFRLGEAGDDLVYERGLLQRYSGNIPLEKIQSVTITDNPLQRAIDYSGLWVETAGYGPGTGGGSQSAVPLATTDRVWGFASDLTDVERQPLERPPAMARRRYLARYSIVATVVVAAAFGASLVWDVPWWIALATYLLVPPAAHLRWANLGYALGEEALIVRAGFWRRRTTILPYYRVQTASTRRSIFQRRLGLASLVIDTASSRTFAWGSPTIYDVDLATARTIHDASRDRLSTALTERARTNGGRRSSGA